VNAYYEQHINSFYVPAGIIQGVMYDPSKSPIYNYSGIGFTIGHEISHALDNHGAEYDYLGHYQNWWTASDRKLYDTEVAKVVQHYSAFKVNNIKINGVSTIGENIADILGLKLSLYSYLKTHPKPRTEILKYFFYRWAEIFRSTETVDYIDTIVKIDEHSPHVIRIDGALAHIDEYYEAFGVNPEDNLYLEEGERLRVV
jgi:putative endopeptidase